MFHKCTIALLSLYSLINVAAQSQMRVHMEAGLLWDAVEGKTYLSGPFFNIEPKLRVSENSTLGLRIGAAINTQRLIHTYPDQFSINNEEGVNGAISIGPSYDHYFSVTRYRPFFGIGLGYNLLSTSKKGTDIRYPLDPISLRVDNQFGLLVRTGINLYKLKIGAVDFSRYFLGMTFNYIPKADVMSSNERVVGMVSTSNFSISVGTIIGGAQVERR